VAMATKILEYWSEIFNCLKAPAEDNHVIKKVS
jgi:hypothetical protein